MAKELRQDTTINYPPTLEKRIKAKNFDAQFKLMLIGILIFFKYDYLIDYFLFLGNSKVGKVGLTLRMFCFLLYPGIISDEFTSTFLRCSISHFICFNYW